ncbi:MAG TPA: M23 family metallopeptidase [Gemmatimonadota bacterium]|nr:M23 family metallopeptidase [Gemmatimonadota bacterium]
MTRSEVRCGLLALVVAGAALAACGKGEADPAGGAPRSDGVAPDLFDRGRLDTERFYRRELAELHARMTEDLLEEAGSLSVLEAFRDRVDHLAGTEAAVLDEDTFSANGIGYYRRTVTFDGTDEVMAVQWGYREGDTIADFFIRPIEPGTSVEYRTRTALRLPFEGAWYVTSGGRTVEENQHGRDYANRFAYDMVYASDLEADGPFASPSDFDTWERPILAPAAGIVIGALDTVPDNPLDVTVGTPAIGNHVVIDHGNGEFSVLGHLRQGSVRVAPGDSIAAGDLLGLVGNSGNSNGPHLHYNLQNGPEPNGARGLPAQFLGYTADGEAVERGEPVRGQIVRHGG